MRQSPQLERRQLDSEALLERIVSACASNVAAFDETGAILYVSRAWLVFAEQNGFTSVKDAYGLYHLQTCQDSAASRAIEGASLKESVQRIIDGRHAEIHEEYVFNGPTTTKWFLMRAARIDMRGGFRALVTLQDITRRRKAEEELRNIGGRLINAQEEERSRLARELHDDLSQRLALLAIGIEQLGQKVPESQSGLRSCVQHLWTQTNELCSDIHTLSYQLHPFKLDHLGLSAAIKSLCEELSGHQGLKIRFQQKGFPAELPEDVTLCVFRIAQESLHNVIKHSGARDAQVTVTRTAGAVRLRISDEGCGFDIEFAKTKKRLGLISMKERLRLVGGEISIHSQPAKGTQIDVLVPVVVKGHEPE